MRQDPLGTFPREAEIVSEPILGCPGQAKVCQETSKCVREPIMRRSQTTMELCPSVYSVKMTVERDGE